MFTLQKMKLWAALVPERDKWACVKYLDPTSPSDNYLHVNDESLLHLATRLLGSSVHIAIAQRGHKARQTKPWEEDSTTYCSLSCCLCLEL